MKKRLFATLLLFATMLLLAACGNQKQDDKYVVYYLNADMTKIVPQEVDLQADDATGQIQELLQLLQQQPEDAGIRQTIPKNIKVLGVTEVAYQVTVDFNQDYYELNPTDEILIRAAIAKTLLQVDKYPYVMFTVDSKQLETAAGTMVGAMNEDSFLENPGEQINSSQKTTLTLYFSSKDGTKLVPENREVHYSSNISLEKLVMEQLMEGPKTKGVLATVPTGTKLITITVVDGVCYVNLDETFLNQNQEISEQIVLYSIVDSLTELSSVSKVQISINGDTSGKCRYTYDLAPMYEQDLSIVDNGEEKVDSTQ